MPGILKGTKQEFTKTIAGSFILHILVIAAGLMLFNRERRTFVSPIYTVNLVAPGPVKRKETPKKPKAAPKQVKKPEPKTAPVEKKASVKIHEPAKPKEKAIPIKSSKADLDEAIKKIASEVKKKEEQKHLDSRIEEIRKKRAAESKEVESRLESIKKEIESSRTQVKPAAQTAPVQEAGSRGGMKREDLEAKYPAYFSLIHDRVQDEWSIYSEDLKDSKLSIIVSVRIARSGKLLESHVEKSSGDSHFDESLIKAIRKAEFPPLPQDFEGESLETGFRFCPGCK